MHDARRAGRRRTGRPTDAGSPSPAAPATPRYEAKDVSWQSPRKIERFFSRLNGEDWIFDRPQHVYVVAADGTGKPRNLTPGEFQHGGVSWLADSSGVVATAQRHDHLGSRSRAATSTSFRSTARSRRSPSRPGTYDQRVRVARRRARRLHRPATTRRRLPAEHQDRRDAPSTAPTGAGSARASTARSLPPPASARRCGSTTSACSPPPRTAATRTCTSSTSMGAPARRSPTGALTVTDFDAAGGVIATTQATVATPGGALGRPRHRVRSAPRTSRSTGSDGRSSACRAPTAPTTSTRGSCGRPGSRPASATRCCSTSTAGRSLSTASRSSTRPRCRPRRGSSC